MFGSLLKSFDFFEGFSPLGFISTLHSNADMAVAIVLHGRNHDSSCPSFL